MKNLQFSQLKKLEIILEGEQQEFATDLLDRAGVKGYTIINNLSGKGRQGFHEGHVMFNEEDVLIMIIAAVPGRSWSTVWLASPSSTRRAPASAVSGTEDGGDMTRVLQSNRKSAAAAELARRLTGIALDAPVRDGPLDPVGPRLGEITLPAGDDLLFLSGVMALFAAARAASFSPCSLLTFS